MPWEKFPIRTVLLVLFLAVLAFVIFGVRFPAKAQESFDQLVSRTAENIALVTGRDTSVIEIRNLEDRDYAISTLLRPDSSFIILTPEAFRVVTLAELFSERFGVETGSLIELYQAQLVQRVRSEDINSALVVFDLGDSIGAMIFSALTNEPFGPLFDFSREFRPPAFEETRVIDRCSPPLTATLNILRRPAESLQICMESVCRGDVAEACTFNATVVEHGLFARVDIVPEAQAVGTISGAQCLGTVTFDVTYLIANVSLLIFETEFGLGLGGSFRSELNCSGLQTITRM
jgi:hypothetical protein